MGDDIHTCSVCDVQTTNEFCVGCDRGIALEAEFFFDKAFPEWLMSAEGIVAQNSAVADRMLDDANTPGNAPYDWMKWGEVWHDNTYPNEDFS